MALLGGLAREFGSTETVYFRRNTNNVKSSVGWAVALGAWAAGFVVLAAFLHRFTDTDVPLTDGFLTAGSLVGQVLLSRKKLENWHVWIAVDVLYVGLYVYKHLALTAILYAVFVVMAAAGLRAWRQELAR